MCAWMIVCLCVHPAFCPVTAGIDSSPTTTLNNGWKDGWKDGWMDNLSDCQLNIKAGGRFSQWLLLLFSFFETCVFLIVHAFFPWRQILLLCKMTLAFQIRCLLMSAPWCIKHTNKQSWKMTVLYINSKFGGCRDDDGGSSSTTVNVLFGGTVLCIYFTLF